MDFYVLPQGAEKTDKENYFTSVAEAAHCAAENGGGTVHLLGGIHFLDKTLNLDENYSNIAFCGEKDKETILSGGVRVCGWKKERENVWSAPFEAENGLKELYVNGKPAVRAASKKQITPMGWYNDISNLRTTVDGVFVNKNDVGLFENADEIQIHYAHSWSSKVVNVKKIVPFDETKNLMVCDGSFGGAIGGISGVAQYTPFYMENVMEFLDSENDFYYNSKEKKIYYYTSGDMTDAEVFAPVLETLVSICGSDLNHKAKNITFSGIKFAHATWYRSIKRGFLVGQANSINTIDGNSNEVLDNNFVPAAVRVSAAEYCAFTDNTFFGIAQAAVGLYEGVNYSKIEKNVFYNIGDSAITVGLPHHNYEPVRHLGYNHALMKKATASEEYGGDEAKRAVSGNLNIGWFTDMPNQWWEVDLGQDTEFDRIEIVSRLDQDQFDSRRDFSVLASTEADHDNFDLLFKAGHNEAFDFRSTLRLDFPERKKYRYVRIKRDIQHYIFINEVRVIDTKMEFVPHKEVCKFNKVSENLITNVGAYNWAAPAISVYYAEGFEAVHNTICNVAYSGISIGWGWSMHRDSVTCRNNTVAYNEVYNHLQKCFDGGAIYTLGNQPGSKIYGNYFHDQPNYPGIIYMDEGTEGYTIYDNVVENTDVSFFIHLPTSKYIKVYDNFTTSPSYSNQGEKCEVWNNELYISGYYHEKAKEIIENAGITDKSMWDRVGEIEVAPEIEWYTNMINDTKTIAEPVFITQYLKKYVFELEAVIDMAEKRSDISEAQIKALKNELEGAYEFLSKPYENRKDVILYRLALKKRVKEILAK